MFERGISRDNVQQVVAEGEEIEQYPEDVPFPSYLMFAVVQGRPLHIVMGYDHFTATGHVVTAYEPDKDKWDSQFRTRRK
jgi:hypothetical protein